MVPRVDRATHRCLHAVAPVLRDGRPAQQVPNRAVGGQFQTDPRPTAPYRKTTRYSVLGFTVHPANRLPSISTSVSTRVVAIIPARYASSRLPGKPLADIGGRPMIEHVYRRVAAAVETVLVATDDEQIARAVTAFGGQARMTRSDHRSGTDRLAEVAETLACDVVVNVQADEPLIEPDMIRATVVACTGDPTVVMSTLRCRIRDLGDLLDPHVVKVAVDRDGYALFFSRAAIGLDRATGREPAAPPVDKHIGLYAYRRPFLLALSRLEPTPLERAERLEQLRALEHGYRIMTTKTEHDPIGVDTPADLDRVRHLVAAGAPV